MDDTARQREREAANGLVEQIASGDRKAEAAMVERYSRGLRFILRRRTRNEHLAEELLQETWLIALEKIRAGGLADPGRLAGYLSGISNNLASGEFRRKERQRTSANSEIVELVADESPSPLQTASRAEICGHVRDLLGDLTRERDRQILERFYVREEEKDEICRDLGVDSTHFNRVLFRARQRLKDLVIRAELRSNLHIVKT